MTVDRLKVLPTLYQALIDGDLNNISRSLLQLKNKKYDEAYTPEKLQEKTAFLKLAKQLEALPPKIQGKARRILLQECADRLLTDDIPSRLMREYHVLLNDTYTFLRLAKAIYVYQTSLITFTAGARHIYFVKAMLEKLGPVTDTLIIGPNSVEEIIQSGIRPEGRFDLSVRQWKKIGNLIGQASQKQGECHVNG